LIAWTQQGPAWVGPIPLKDGRRGTVVVVGDRANPKGAALVLPPEDGADQVHMPISEAGSLIQPWYLIEILCMQERAFGSSDLPVPQASGA
jgi:hypothetical protein